MPSNNRPWPAGKSFYHYDKIYDRDDVGYHGPTFAYASMPDQYIFAALQRLELAKTHRRPAVRGDRHGVEPPAVEPHPRMIPWNKVGNGSIYNRIPVKHTSTELVLDTRRGRNCGRTAPAVRAAYGQSIVYTMNTLISFVQHYGKNPNLVMIVLGDHQPLDRSSAGSSRVTRCRSRSSPTTRRC